MDWSFDSIILVYKDSRFKASSVFVWLKNIKLLKEEKTRQLSASNNDILLLENNLCKGRSITNQRSVNIVS